MGYIAIGNMRGQELRAVRSSLGVTQAELARRMGVTWNTVARWETGQRKVPKIAEVLLGYIERETRTERRTETRKMRGRSE
jgi:DNA-binding transcriptional regulator YiaG